MAHKTLVGGIAYDVKGGKTLVGGTVYDVKSGKTLVGGTAYDVKFGLTDLTDTYWKLNNVSQSASSSYTIYYVNRLNYSFNYFFAPLRHTYISSSVSGNYYSDYSVSQTSSGHFFYGYFWSTYTGSTGWGQAKDGSSLLQTSDDYRYIHITGGSDVCSSFLIDFLTTSCIQCNSSWIPL